MKSGRLHGPAWSLMVVLLVSATSFASTLPNGLTLEAFEVKADQPALVGTKVHIEYSLKNLGDAPILLESPGLFVGARCDGNAADFGHQKKARTLRPGESVSYRASRVLDKSGAWSFWPGFHIGGAFGPAGWMEKRLDVFADRAEAEAALKPLSISRILANPARYDQRDVTVTGEAFIVRKKVDRNKKPWNLISLVDPKDRKKVISAFALGHAPIGNGDLVEIKGVFKVKSLRGKYHYDNEIDARKGSIQKLP